MKHFFLRDKNGFPVACIASTIVRSDGTFVDEPLTTDSRIAFAISVHNPVDTFDRRLARSVAEQRLIHKRGHIINATKPVKPTILNSLLTDFMMTTHDGQPVRPSHRVRKAAELWLKQYERGEKTYRGKNNGEHQTPQAS